MNDLCFFVSDLHGRKRRYEKLFEAIRAQKPALVLMGGDLLPHPRHSEYDDFLLEYLAPGLSAIKQELKDQGPLTGMILGNDDARIYEKSALLGAQQGIWSYLHGQSVPFSGYDLVGYSYVPPTPFQLKDWERYDVSHYVDPGCIPPDEGKRSIEVPFEEIENSTIQKDLQALGEGRNLSKTIFLFHAPPYQSMLDRAALDGRHYDHVPLDVHVGSIAIQRFIEERQPYITLHGHVHESSRITGQWKQTIGNTCCFSGAYDGEELALVSFPLHSPADARRELL